MANGIFQPGGLLGPVAPGLSPMLNPGAFIGFGINQGQPLQGLAAMGNLALSARAQAMQQENQAYQRQQAEQARQAALMQRETMVRLAQQSSGALVNALAPGVNREQAEQLVDTMAAADPQGLMQLAAKRLFPEPRESYRPPTAEERRIYSLPADEPYRISTLTGKPERIGAPATQITNIPSLGAGWRFNPRTMQAERVPGFETEPQRKERVAQESFQSSFSALDQAAARLRNDPANTDNLVKFRVAAEQFAEDLASRRAAPRSPTDADVERAMRQAVGLSELALGTYDATMDQLATQFSLSRPEIAKPEDFAPPGDEPQMTDEEFQAETEAREQALRQSQPYTPRGNPFLNR